MQKATQALGHAGQRPDLRSFVAVAMMRCLSITTGTDSAEATLPQATRPHFGGPHWTAEHEKYLARVAITFIATPQPGCATEGE